MILKFQKFSRNVKYTFMFIDHKALLLFFKFTTVWTAIEAILILKPPLF